MSRSELTDELIRFHIRDLSKTRNEKASRVDALMALCIDEGRTADVNEAEEFDVLVTQVKKIDEHMARLRRWFPMQCQFVDEQVDDHYRQSPADPLSYIPMQ